MAKDMSAFPTIPLGALQGNDDYTQKYMDAMQKVSEALEKRINQPSTNLFDVAGAFLAPTRTGSFFESLGKASSVLGEQQRRAEERELPIAQMRAQLAAQQYQMGMEAQSQKALRDAVKGFDEPTLTQAMSSPAGAIGNPDLMQRLAKAQMEAQPGTKAYDQIKNMIETQSKMIDLGVKTGQFSLDQLKTLYETGMVPAGMQAPVERKPSEKPAGISANPLLQVFAGGESGMRNVPNQAGTSSAFGPYQITQGTFEQVKKDIPALKDATWEDFKKDVGGIQTPIAEALLGRNQSLLASANLPSSPLNQYSVWFSGDTKLASSDPKTPIDQVMSKEAIQANSLQGKTVGDVMNMLQANLQKGASYVAAQPTPARAAPPDTDAGSFTTADGLTIYRGNMTQKSWEAAKIDAQKNAVDRMSTYQTKRKEEMAKSDVEQITGLRNAASTAENLWQLASNQISIVNANPTAFGYLNDPSASSAFFRALKDAQNKGMSFNPDEVARYVKGVTDPNDLNALALFANNAIQLNLEFAKMNFKGQGAVTDAERRMIETLGGITFDSPEVIRLKADALRKNSERNRAVHEAWLDFEDKNPNATYNQFLRSPALKEIKSQYQNIFEQMRKDTQEILRPTTRAKTTASPAVGTGMPNYVDQLNAVTGQ